MTNKTSTRPGAVKTLTFDPQAAKAWAQSQKKTPIARAWARIKRALRA